MPEVNWAELNAEFADLVGQAASERAPRLEIIRRRDPLMAQELDSLLEAHDSADGFLEDRMEAILKSIVPLLACKFELRAGDRLLHFEIIDFLGEGSVAKVYLARDLELDRLIALKVTQTQNREARTLAHFSIDGIVRIYSEHIASVEGKSIAVICLQYVPGPTLSTLQKKMFAVGESTKSLTQLLEGFSRRHADFEPAAFKWSELLSSLALPQALVLLGMRLAEILDHAHAAGILHLDIKPANILLDLYGRPYLSDFNVSTHQKRLAEGDLGGLGGTLYYMSPEQKRLFAGGDRSSARIDAKCDVYSLGVVLRDLVPSAYDAQLNEIFARATDPRHDFRTPTARHLAEELAAWLRTRLAEEEMPKLWKGLRWIVDYPLLGLLTLNLAAQFLASLVNITYNRLQIMASLNAAQNMTFLKCVSVYNLVTYPTTMIFTIYALRHLLRNKQNPDRAHASTLQVPGVIFLVVSYGWLPGAWIFPFAIEHFSGPISASIYWQFAGSFSLAWLISLTTSLAVSIFVQTRVLYPKYWQGQAERAARELRHCERLNHSLVFASALIPMSGVLLALLTMPTDLDSGFHAFKVFMLMIVGFGLANLLFIQSLTRIVDTVFAALKRPRSFD